ncbi:MAG: hypothetical protein L0220_27440, partial [Acidobacteria bacterium]|nr:hypothetical protein [Acidobacteriota bacterium]
MANKFATKHRSNQDIFIPYNSGSPQADLERHTSGLGLTRLDFERGAIAGDVIYTIESDSTPTSQQDEEARIATLAYALKKLGNPEDAAEFMRCLNAICVEGDARYRQMAASYYYGEIAERGVGIVLKEMALIGMQLASLNPFTEEVETGSESVYALSGKSKPRSLFDLEVAGIERMIRGRRKSASFAHDEWTEWLNDLEANGASLKELDDAFAHVEALDQYDEGGAIIHMSAHERAVTCGRIDPEFSVDDLPEQARHLAGKLRRDYVDGVEIEKIWDEMNAELEIIFPVSVNLDLPKDYFPTNLTKGRDERIAVYRRPKFISHANRELQQFTRQVLEAILNECEHDFHLTAQRKNRAYRHLYIGIRRATGTGEVGELMKQAYEVRQNGDLSVKHFIALNTAAANQRERMLSKPLSATALKVIKEITTASERRLKYLAWTMYGNNQPSHPIHTLRSQEQTRVWEVMTACKAAILLPRLYTKLLTTWG